MTGIIDTHCHLDYLTQDNLSKIIERSLQTQVEQIITIAVSPDNQDKVLEIAKQYDGVFCSQGVHPHEASSWTIECQEKILNNIKQPEVVAIGEIGLDYHYEHSPRSKQIDIFEKQIQIAIDHKLPIIVHTREAEEDTLSILKNFTSKIKNNLVLHSYTSGKELATFAIEHNYFLGFNGIITFKAAQNVRDILHICPKENLVVETDAPYLAPIPYRGRENSPVFLPAIVKFISSEKKIPLDDLTKILSQNSNQLFQLF